MTEYAGTRAHFFKENHKGERGPRQKVKGKEGFCLTQSQNLDCGKKMGIADCQSSEGSKEVVRGEAKKVNLVGKTLAQL